MSVIQVRLFAQENKKAVISFVSAEVHSYRETNMERSPGLNLISPGLKLFQNTVHS